MAHENHVAGPVSPALQQAVAARIDPLVVPCALIGLGAEPTSPTSSFVGGRPYLPRGGQWPCRTSQPALLAGDTSYVKLEPYQFVMQINFAEVPPLPGFPSRGLMQWFVQDTDFDFGVMQPPDGFAVRWYEDPSVPPSLDSSVPLPPGLDERDLPDGENSPIELERPGPVALTFSPARCAPGWTDLPEELRQDPIWSELAAATGNMWQQFGYEEYVRGEDAAAHRHVHGSKVGGFPEFCQDDPRGSWVYPSPDAPAGRSLVELTTGDEPTSEDNLGDWGGSGIGSVHLFGDPSALASGDVRHITYHWDSA